MGIFDIFKGNKNSKKVSTTDNGVLGPAYLDGLTSNFNNPGKLSSHEWRRKLVSKSGERNFRIKYYGNIHPSYKLITQTEFAPVLVYAETINSKESILIFDGCKYGYNAMFCDQFTNEQIEKRPTDKYYLDQNGNDVFELIINTQNGIEYDEEFWEEVDDNGNIELIDGSSVKFEEAKRNGFDWIMVKLVTKEGKEIDCLSEETA